MTRHKYPPHLFKFEYIFCHIKMASTSINIKDWRSEIPGKLSPDSITWEFPTVQSISKTKKPTEWKVYVRVLQNNSGAFLPIDDSYFDNQPLSPELRGWIKVDSGFSSGKTKVSVPTVVSVGKNLGKVSATNVFCQALRDAYGLYNKQLKKANVGIAAGTMLYPPMLAQVLKDQKKPLDYTKQVFVQRKYNGIRAVATISNGEVTVYSRRGIPYPGLSYIKYELKPILHSLGGGVYLDGELFRDGMPLQELSGYARKEEQLDDIQVDYMVYDCFVPEKPTMLYSERRTLLDGLFENCKYCKCVETFAPATHSEIECLYKRFLAEGYEGAMVRLDSPYQYSYNEYHSKLLLKMKPSYDMEVEILSWTTGRRGKAAKALMLVCQTPEGRMFNVTPAMELLDRVELAKKMTVVEENGNTHFENHWKHRKLIITYDEMSKDLVPQRARTEMKLRMWD